MKRYLILSISILILFSLESCKRFLDVVPDNVATLENAFSRRIEAEKYLHTCYSYLPKHGDIEDDPAVLAGDELWRYADIKGFMEVARGFQNKITPLGDRWEKYYAAIRDCNIFLENVNKVPDLDEIERERWVAEVKFLKAYYNFYLVKMYGPIAIIDKTLPVDVTGDQVNITRAPVDACFNYIIALLDESLLNLPLLINNPTREMGRITTPIAASLKAEVLVYAASPLFNGNTDMTSLKNADGTKLFNTAFSKEKWDKAAAACKEAIDICHQAGYKLYEFPGLAQFNLSAAIKTQLSIRNVITEKWNSEIIWANTQTNSSTLQRLITPFLDPQNLDLTVTRGELSPTLSIAEMFYTKNGVPINEDINWAYDKRYTLKTSVSADELYIRKDYVSAYLNFDRESRFYADLGFDGGVWYGQGIYDDSKPADLFYIAAKFRQRNGYGKPSFGSVTGYFLKKLIHYENVIGKTGNEYSVVYYPSTIMRLADLYLLYAEALNESEGPVSEVHTYIDLVRKRANLNTVKFSWDNFSTNASKYTTQVGMREIIHRERLIELAFEGKRFWDLRRWKEAARQLNFPIKGWDMLQENAADYYRPSVLYNQTFGSKDYFWPIKESTLNRNLNLVQNPGW